MKNANIIFTIGHSTRDILDFIEILKEYGIEEVIDIRTIPKSRHNPQFNENVLGSFLKGGGIKYLHLKELGGLRHTEKDSVNHGWRNLSFRGFADYMQTHEFKKGLERLIRISKRHRIAIMCAEAVPWRCHRSLIADALSIRGILVSHIMSKSSSSKHEITSFAKIKGKEIVYP
ncbi:MAG: DUF488 domain-containing protein [Nanoarchaeota archaeon]|nr:DUF488 domain-containing protein [Nanoarchaeota archaeon]